MKAKANPKAVGAFVVGAVLLAVAIAAVFGSGRLFRAESRHVAFFEDSLQGLNIGSPVQFRGVPVGTVVDIKVLYQPETYDITVAAILTLQEDRIQEIQNSGRAAEDPEEEMERLIELGLRAQLTTRSVVTGQQAISLVFQPDTEVRMIGLLPGDEIPTIKGGLGQIQQAIESDGPKLVAEARAVVQNANDFLSEENKELVNKILVDLSKFTGALGRSDQEVEQIATGLVKLVDDADETVLEFRDVGQRANTILADNEEGIKVAIDNVGSATGQVETTAATIDAVLEENRVAIKDFTNTGLYELTNLIVDTQDLVEDVRRVVGDLERDPARFLFGDQQQGVTTE